MTQNSAHTGKLYVVGTPIGNLGDLSPRVGEAFAAAEDAVKLQQGGNDKARYAITIDGDPVSYTNEDSTRITTWLQDNWDKTIGN